MKTTSLKLQRIAAVFAILTAPMPALAIVGPTVSTWIPGAEIVETVGTVSTTRQPGPYNSRDTYKVFVTAVAGKDLRLVVTGSAGVKVDYFDQQRDNGLYAIVGAVDEGTMTLDFQTAPTGTTTWTSAGTKVLTVGPRRTLIYDTADVPINTWWDCKSRNPLSPTPAEMETILDTDFANLKANGFTCVNLVWKLAWNSHRATYYANLTQHGLKVQQTLYKANAYVQANLDNLPIFAHHNVKLLELEVELNAEMLADVGGGVALKDHPQLWTYGMHDESNAARGDELQAMLIKSIDPEHAGANSHQGQISNLAAKLFVQSAFSDFIVTQEYPLDTGVAVGDFTFGNTSPADLPRLNTPDNMDWARKKDVRRELEMIVQAFGGGGFRDPTPKELRAMTLMAASRGARPITYFIYGFPGGPSLLGPPYLSSNNANLDEAKSVNLKLQGWMPIYKNLYRDENGTKIPYTQVAASSGNFFFSGFESAETTFGAVNTAGVGANGSARFGQMPANEILQAQLISGAPLDTVPMKNSCVYTAWVKDNGDPNMTYRLAARFVKNDGNLFTKYGSFVPLAGTGWEQLTLDLTPEAVALDGAAPQYEGITHLYIQANTLSTPVAYSVDDVKLAYGQPAHIPTYGLNGGVVGTFLHAGTGKRYIMVVNTDVVNTKTVTVNVIKNGGGAATTAKDVDTGTVYNLTSGNLNISLAAGDGALLEVDAAAGTTTLYSNNMETATTYGSGTLVTTPAPHGGLKSEQRPADAVTYSSALLNLALPASVSNFTYSVWLHDNNNATQTYTLYVRFKNPATGALSATSGIPYTAIGSSWTQLSGDFTSIVNQRIGEGYTQLSSISLRASNSGAYVPFYADDVLVQYQ